MAENNVEEDIASIEDDRPLAVRRKRRSSTALAAPAQAVPMEKAEDEEEQPQVLAKTPTKPKKRVRFSDPGLEVSLSISSTGLTPHLQRATFSPKARAPSEASRRLSLPIQLSSSLPSPSLSPSPVPFSGEVQFEPLRQILDARLKRRLRRNNLSDEINDIGKEKRSKVKWEQEIQALKQELVVAKDAGHQEHSEGKNVEVANSDKIRGLEQQLTDMRNEMRERSMTAEPPNIRAEPRRQLTSDMDIFVDETEDEFVHANTEEGEGHGESRPLSSLPSVNEVATQASLPPLSHTETLREARLSLEYLFPGEISLGLVPEDPKPLLDVMLQRLRSLKAEVLISEDSLSTTRNQESNMRIQFNAVLEQLERARKYAETISTRSSNDKARADTSQARVQVLENTVQAAAKKVQSMEKESDEKDRSILKLQDALGSYRVEVSKLESLITRMESEQGAALSGLRAEMDEAVADLECHVVAETRGRREAEHEVEQRDVLIKELKVREQELQNAVNEKQQIIREAESIFQEERLGREREVGGLNVQIGKLSSDLSESSAKVLNAEEKQEVLMRKLEEERDAGLRAVEAVQAELAKCTDKAEEVKTAHIQDSQRRGVEVTQHQGLLTPVSATRFKDVEGYVEVRRGKGRKRPDSGIVILEEDIDEDTIMADDL